jgi:hypothetical protein
LLSSRACYSSFGKSKFHQYLPKKPTIFGHIALFYRLFNLMFNCGHLVKSKTSVAPQARPVEKNKISENKK